MPQLERQYRAPPATLGLEKVAASPRPRSSTPANLIRADARGEAKLMLSPPLIAGKDELDELIAGVDQVLDRFATALTA